jgi:hypothetical protein
VSGTPTRILDTRTDVGLNGPFVSGVSQTLQITGTVATQPPGDTAPVNAEVAPSTATSVVLNVTVVRPSTKRFLSIRPGNATGFPATSNINWAAGGANIANSVTVQLPTAGDVNIFVNGTVGHVLVDVAGYNLPATSGLPGADGANGPIEGSPCTAGGITGTVQTSFDAATGALAVRCSRPGYVSTLDGAAGSSGSTNGSTARLRSPIGVAVDTAGNVYVADTGNHTIRKIG